jgi:hypothetical protein
MAVSQELQAFEPAHPALTGYQPDADKRRTVYYLAAATAALSAFCMLPALAH